MRVMYKDSQRVPVKIWSKEVEQEALDQLEKIATLPFVYKHVAAMPDVHLGIGTTVGVKAVKNRNPTAADISCTYSKCFWHRVLVCTWYSSGDWNSRFNTQFVINLLKAG